MRLPLRVPLAVAVAALLMCACRTADTAPRASAAVQQVVEGKPLYGDDVWPAVTAFYERRHYAPAWSDGEYATNRAAEALVALRSADEHGFRAEDFGETSVLESHRVLDALDKEAVDRPERLAEFDVRLTGALLALGRAVALGRTVPSAIASSWKARRQAPDFAGLLAQAVESGSVKTWLDQVRPTHPDYAALQKAYVSLRGQRDKGGWPTVPAGRFNRGQSHPAVVALRQRLAAGGMLSGDAAANTSQVFDEELQGGVRAFQELHAIKATGRVDQETLAAMNVPIEDRLRQVALNLERWRWMPDSLGARHLLVNIPHFHLIAREDGKVVMDMRVVVGKRGNETPVFSGEMETVVFSPYWNIPDSIKQGETAPAVMRDPDYLERNNIEVLRGSRRVDVNSIDWNDPSQLRQLAFRQRPGPNNALGHVKFLFPNSFDVYLHDTPADSLFERRGRAFSHGCVRVEEPELLAKYVLRDDPDWDGPQIIEAMHSGNERSVTLEKKIPVHIVYFTAWVDEHGGLHFQPDIYGYDQKQSAIATGHRHATSAG